MNLLKAREIKSCVRILTVSLATHFPIFLLPVVRCHYTHYTQIIEIFNMKRQGINVFTGRVYIKELTYLQEGCTLQN